MSDRTLSSQTRKIDASQNLHSSATHPVDAAPAIDINMTPPPPPPLSPPSMRPVAVPRASAADVEAPHRTARQWNTADLGLRIGGDVAAASAAAGLVAPVIYAIDRSIIENAASQRTITQSLRASAAELLTRPLALLTGRPFRLIFLLYASTYFAANTVDTASSTLAQAPRTNPTKITPPSPSARPHALPSLDPRDPASTTAGLPKFLATSATNLTLCVYKDTHFARLFGGAAGPARASPLPKASLALFAARDSLTIFASFVAPARVAALLGSAGYTAERYVSRASAAQFLAPAAVQLLSTPLHLWGLDLYNRPGAGAGARVARVVRDWGASCAARVARIVPAFGVGGVVNAAVRRRWMQGLPYARDGR